MGDEPASRDGRRESEREAARRTRQLQIVVGVAGLAVYGLQAVLMLVSASRDGTLGWTLLMLAVILLLCGLFLLWILRPSRVIRQFQDRAALVAAISSTRDRYLGTRLLWIAFAMARDQVRRGSREVLPSDFLPEVRLLEQRMMCASVLATAVLSLMSAGLGAVIGYLALVVADVGPFFQAGMALLSLASFCLAVVFIRRNRSRDAALGRSVLATRHLGSAERWSRLLELAAEDVGLE